MNGDYDPVDVRTGSPQRSLLRWLAIPALTFLLGLGAMGYLLSHWQAGARFIGAAPQAPRPVAAQPAPVQPVAQAPAPVTVAATGDEPERIVIDPEITRRVGALEQRIGQLDTQSRAAVGNADRAEGLLVAFAARRALDRGVPLGFLEALLSQRFGQTQPQAVGLIITAAREPVTLQQLQDELAQLGPQLVGAGPDQSWWTAVQTELGSLITVRRADTPSPEPTERFARATRWLEAGQVDVALVEVLRLPGRGHARDWAMKARRYVLARRALDAIETAALLEPRVQPTAAPAAAPPPRMPAAATPRRPNARQPAARPSAR
jgi:hypothetical protein